MTGNNVTYTYGTSGTERGRPIRITDGSGMYECQYDSLGNVTAETRTIVLPNSHEEFSLTMKYEYDSWGRMLSMTYPDGEKVSYTYQWGGDLYSMHGNKDDNHRVYVSKILYNTFGQRSQVEYGNQTKAYYTYDTLHRLVNLKSRNGSGTLMQDISYTFDSASNVTGIVNTAGVVNSLGGGYGNSYQYDALHRLVSSTGGGASTGTYNMTIHYSGSGRIRAKYRSSLSPTLSGTVNTYYGYCDEYQPHAVRRIYDEYNQKHYDFRWDASGNLGQVSYGNEDAQFESGRFMYWTEDSRMHVAVDDNHYSYYAYDYSGERRIKLTGDNSVLDVNADYMRTISTLENVTLYPSAYMVLTDRGYTKHYYTGMERVAARIGDGGLDVGFYLSNTDSLHARANRLFSQSLAQVNRRVLEANDVDCIMDGEMPVEELGIPFEEIPEQMSATVGTEYGEFFGAMHLVSNAGESPEVYYYHGDHLGSASWKKERFGKPFASERAEEARSGILYIFITAVQHLQYLPFGERFVDQRTSGYSERFTFTGKERDEETGYGYFGARYMDHELMTSFISVDRYADKYPFISPYAYCLWNPIQLTDPTGDTVVITGDHELVEKALSLIRLKSNNLYFSLEDGGQLKAFQRGEGLTAEEAYMLEIINSTEVKVNLRVLDKNCIAPGYEIDYGGGSYCGNILRYNTADNVIGVDAMQAININTISKFDKLLWSTGELIWHEISEAYEGGLIAINTKQESPPSNRTSSTYFSAHCAASSHFLGDIDTDCSKNPTVAVLYNKCEIVKQ